MTDRIFLDGLIREVIEGGTPDDTANALFGLVSWLEDIEKQIALPKETPPDTCASCPHCSAEQDAFHAGFSAAAHGVEPNQAFEQWAQTRERKS